MMLKYKKGISAMIKGVTKSIIEIRPSAHEHYEKIILILKDTPDSLNQKELEQCAALMLEDTPPNIVSSPKRHVFSTIIMMLLSSVISVSACLIISLFV